MLRRFKLINFLEFTAFLLVISLVFIMFVQVFARQFFDKIPIWSGEEVATLLLIWLVNIGAAVAAGRNTHISMDYIVEKFPQQWRNRIEIVVYTVICLFLLTVGVILFQLAWSGRGASTARLNISMFWIQISMFVGMIIMSYYYVKLLIKSICNLRGKSKNSITKN
ncbi:TRAP transporter small permease [Halalkalibacter alkaliphilus]|uniref:TRAP transporter small permease n=1 Tax=Halalkalibacter alkaliphilus TaxID=2917993 RepID=A0A9X1ZUF4_9BACI|nr:TRAP transporter small permease [Halalkalibacter alkaliphilus]MCL7745704.1 TRAP transporter small permease [Halalkalibacter alkaliphilus]